MAQSLPRKYTAAYRLWFKGLGDSAAPPDSVLKRWWGFGKSKEEGRIFNQQCSDLFSDTLKGISPHPIQSEAEAESISNRLLNQIPRHIYRDDRASIAYLHFDPIAQAVAKTAIGPKIDTPRNHNISPYRQWFYMPFVHAEEVEKHEAVARYYALPEMNTGQDAKAEKYLNMGRNAAIKHFDIIKKFGWYPHRNACFNRQSTPEEEKWMAKGGTYY